TILIKNSSSSNVLTLDDISYPLQNLKIIETCIASPLPSSNKRLDVSKLISQGEHESLEFKSSLRFDRHSRAVNRELEKSVLKTIAAFLNSKGGSVIIGVGDAGELIGVESDYQTLKHRNSDGFENHFTQIFNSAIGPEFRQLAKLRFHKIGERDVCVVDVAPSARPAYLKFDDVEHFYIRTGNVSTPLKLSEVESYVRSRWPRWS
ncbi:MAG: ATP-binding protein, partial [Patescibacteria group bacterium]